MNAINQNFNKLDFSPVPFYINVTTAPYPFMVPGSFVPQVECWVSSCNIDILIKMWRFLPAEYSSEECMCISVNLQPHYRLDSFAVCVCDLPVSLHLFHVPLPQKWLQSVGHGASLVTGCSSSYSSFFLNLASESRCFNIPQLEFKNTLQVSYKQLLNEVMLIKTCGLLIKQCFFIIVAFILILMSVQLERLSFRKRSIVKTVRG